MIPLVKPDEPITDALWNAMASALNALTKTVNNIDPTQGVDQERDVVWVRVEDYSASGSLWCNVRRWDDTMHCPVGPVLRLIGTLVSPLPELTEGKIVAARRFREPDRFVDTFRLIGSGAAGEPSAYGSVFPVICNRIGGSAGSFSETCSFTYNVTTLGGVTVGEGMAPRQERIPYTTYMTGSNAIGLAYRDEYGTAHLYSVSAERPVTATEDLMTTYSIDGVDFKRTTTEVRVLDASGATSTDTIHSGDTCGEEA